MNLMIVLLFLKPFPSKFYLIGIELGLVQFLLFSEYFLFQFLILDKNIWQIKNVLICILLKLLHFIPFFLESIESLGEFSLQKIISDKVLNLLSSLNMRFLVARVLALVSCSVIVNILHELGNIRKVGPNRWGWEICKLHIALAFIRVDFLALTSLWHIL